MFSFFFQHERFLHDGKVSLCDVLFIGDSLIRNMKETDVCIPWVKYDNILLVSQLHDYFRGKQCMPV